MQPRRNPRKPAYSAAHFLLELDQNESAGFVRAAEGGGIRSATMSYHGGESHAVYKQQGAPSYEDLKFQVGMSMSRSFYTWIEGFFKGQVVRKNGAIVAADFSYNEQARRTFSDALISEVTLPKLEKVQGGSQPCYMGVTVVPERITFERGTGVALSQQVGVKQKLWTPNHFDFAIDGFEQSTRRTTRFEGFTIKQKIHEYRSGEFKDSIRVPGRIELPNLAFSIPETDSAPLLDHFKKAVVDGKRPEGRMTGHLTMKDNDDQLLCTIHLDGIEIASIGADKSDATSRELKLVRIEVAIEGLRFEYASDGIDA